MKYFTNVLSGILLLHAGVVFAQSSCSDIFPGPVQNATAAGSVTLNWRAQVTGATGNTLETTNLSDYSGQGTGCGSGPCSASGTEAAAGTYSGGFPGGPSVTTNWGQSITMTPGDYGSFYHGGNATVFFEPGVYTFSGTFGNNSAAEISVSSPGSVTIFVQGDITLGYQLRLNTANSDRFVFMYSSANITIANEVDAHGIFYGENVSLQYRAAVRGSITARGSLQLANETVVDYDSGYVTNTDFDGFCDPPVVVAPAPLAEWRLDEAQWNGSANQVLDYSGNDLHGRSIAVGGNHPVTAGSDRVIAGDPGTCNYGDFAGTTDGFVQIDDPGTGSILDLNTSFAVAVWVYPRSWPAGDLMSIVSKDENFEFHLNTLGRVNWWWGGGDRSLTSNISVPTDGWHHVAISFTNGSQVIYIDGVSAATHNSTQAITVNNDPVLIGTDLGFNGRNFDGYIDEVKIYDQALTAGEVAAIMAETHDCFDAPAIDHFLIDVGSGAASTCLPQSISITAQDAANNTLSAYTGSVNLATSTGNGNWTTTGVPADALGNLIPGAADSGNASYQFEASGNDNGTITLDLNNSHAETLTITVVDPSAGVSSTSANLTFSENAFVVSSTDSLGDDVIANRRHNFQVQMVREDPDTGSCGVAIEYTAASVKTWITRSAADPGGAGPQVSNAAASSTASLGSTPPAGPNFTLPFINGQADFTLLASDVGAWAMNFLDDSSGFSDQDINGGSGTYVARPFGFYLEVTDNPGAVDASGGILTAAGNNFELNVSAVGWDATDDVNDDGIPDGHNDSDPANNTPLGNNAVLNSFGNESPGESVQLGSVLLAPAGGNDPGLATSAVLPADGRIISSFSGGTGSTNSLYFSEVGIIEISANIEDGDYLGAGNVFSARTQSQSSYVGRFTPVNFAVLPGSMNEACTLGMNYSYMGEPFSVEYQLEARNTFDVITSNYRNDFVKLNASDGSLSFGAIDLALPTPLSDRLTHQSTGFTWGNGTGALVSNIVLERGASPDGPYDQVDIGVIPVDEDGVGVAAGAYNLDTDNDTSSDHVRLEQTEVRYGRLRLADSFGPETANLPVDFVTEYWNGSIWAVNEDDSCTSIALSQIDFDGDPIDVAANRTVSVGGGSSTGVYNSLAGSAVNFSNGNAGHYFTAPGTGNMGEINVDVNLTLYPWLRFDWDQDGDHSDSALPTATFTFGSYRGHDRIIYWQEILTPN